MTPLLRIRGLRKEFRTGFGAASLSIRAVDGVDLEVQSGETLGLVGESGCGKSTLARCALRLTEPTSGSIEFDGIDLRSLTPAELRRKRREFQMIFQDAAAALDPRMTVARVLREPYEVQGLGSRRQREVWVRELLQGVSLDPALADRRPAQLSGGQQQRVVIARALALKPRLIIADEPVSAQDASVQAQILNLLAGLQRSLGLTLILVSHSLPVIHYLATRVAVMYLGRVVEEGPAEDFFRGPKHPYGEALLQSMPVLHPGLRVEKPRLAGEVPSAANPPAGCRFHPRCPKALALCRTADPEFVSLKEDSRVACFLYASDRAEGQQKS